MRKRHIIIIDDLSTSRYNGVGTYVNRLAADCVSEGMKVSLVPLNSGSAEFNVEEKCGMTVYSFPVCSGGWFLKTGVQTGAVLRMNLADSEDNVFVINHSPCHDFMKALKKYFRKSRFVFVIHNQGWNSALLGNVDLIKAVLTEKKIDPKVGKEMTKYLRDYAKDEKRVYRLADAVICLSESTYRILKDIYRADMTNIHLIPNGVEPIAEDTTAYKKEARRSLGLREDETILLFAGRVTASKGLTPLLKGFSELCKEHEGLRLLIAGPGSETLGYIERTDIACRSRISCLGFVEADKMNTLYAAADICVIPSYTEQCSYVTLEMMTHGKPIVSSDSVGQKDILTDGKDAVLFSHGENSSEELKTAISKILLMAEQQRTALGKEARKTLSEKFSSKLQIGKTTELFRSL